MLADDLNQAFGRVQRSKFSKDIHVRYIGWDEMDLARIGYDI
jgi:hypothetical protein